jgi:hypothetical protein
MVIAATLVIGPFTWYHQFTWLLIPLVTIACCLIRARRRWLFALLGVLVVGIDANELLWTRLQRDVIASGLYRGLSLPFLAALILWAGAATTMLAKREPAGSLW